MRRATRIPLVRIAVLDRAIRAGQYPNARSLAGELEVCARTVRRDLDFMHDQLLAPVAFDPRRNGYFYTDPTFRLPFWSLTEGELVAVFLAERVLQQYRGTPWAETLARAFVKLAQALPDRVTVDLGHLDHTHSFRTTAPTDIPPQLFTDLELAIRTQRRIAVRYWTASRDEETDREVDPYHLASVDGQWYLVGFCHLRGAVRQGLRVPPSLVPPSSMPTGVEHSLAVATVNTSDVCRPRRCLTAEVRPWDWTT